MVFFPVRTVLARNRPARLFSYLGEASRERSPTAGRISMPFLRGEVKVREIGHNSVREKGLVNNVILPDFANFPL